MHFLDLTLPTPAANLALDEALLDAAEEDAAPHSLLRIWEPGTPLVVVGRSSKLHAEVRSDVCRAHGVPVLRRASGGAAIVTGPGCLMYAVVLDYATHPALQAVDHAHQFVLSTIAGALSTLVPGVHRQGISDLVLGDRKFSGNSVRCKRDHLLYHGTVLYDFPLPWIEHFLALPPRQPEYRAGRSHDTFVANLPAARAEIAHALRQGWNAFDTYADWPRDHTAQLTATRYLRPEWNEGR